jgi:hypothetical protein
MLTIRTRVGTTLAFAAGTCVGVTDSLTGPVVVGEVLAVGDVVVVLGGVVVGGVVVAGAAMVSGVSDGISPAADESAAGASVPRGATTTALVARAMMTPTNTSSSDAYGFLALRIIHQSSTNSVPA